MAATTYCALDRNTDGYPRIRALRSGDRPIEWRRASRLCAFLTRRFLKYGAPAAATPAAATPAAATPAAPAAPAAPATPATPAAATPATPATPAAPAAATPARVIKLVAESFAARQRREHDEEAYLIDGRQSYRY